MASPLLETKFHVPTRRSGLVARPRLSERLSHGWESALTLVSAPAGFGKTTLIAEWITGARVDGRAAAWLSLDQRDNDPAAFIAYLIAALETAAPGIGAGALSLLRSPQSSMEAVLATLLNDLHAVSTDVVVVLDDYHVIEQHEVQEAMAFLLEHLPAQIHLVISSRADPVLPLARLRAGGELVEVRAADLRFTPDEAAAYLNGLMGLELTARDVAALETRTEGWIAALQLAALSMQGRDDTAGFIASFAGDDRYVFDYLVGEVLQRQPEDVRNFLLETSVLSALTGSLCDAVTGRDGGTAMLEALDRANLFVVPLDDRRRWCRYHHLFADVLRAHLLDEHPDRVHELHMRASDWYERNGDRPEAIRQAMAGHGFTRAADLVELAIPAMRQARQESTLRRWLEALPDELFPVRPALSLGYVGVLLAGGEVGGVEALLQHAERLIATTAAQQASNLPATAMVVVAHDELPRLPTQIAVFRSALARIQGDAAGSITHARRALDLVDDDDHLGRGSASGLLALAYWTSGDLDAAHHSWSEAIASLDAAGYTSDVIGCSIALADIRITQGRLGEAMAVYELGLKRASGQGVSVLRGAADMHVGISELLRERNELDAAAQHLQTSSELGEHAGFGQNPYRWHVAMARVRQAQGDLDGALDLLDRAQGLYVSDFYPEVRPVAAMRARLRLVRGEVDEALQWVRQRQLSVDDQLSYLGEFEHITLAKTLLAKTLLAEHTTAGNERSLHEAIELLERLRTAAQAGQRTGAVIEIIVTRVLADHARGDIASAIALLEEALTLSEPEGYVRVYLDEGASMLALLSAASRKGVARDSVRHLLAAASETAPRRSPQRGLVEPLSERELDVLRLLRTDLNGPDIARQLMVSLNTMRSHTKHIYTKLGVTDRRAALRRAEDLGL